MFHPMTILLLPPGSSGSVIVFGMPPGTDPKVARCVTLALEGDGSDSSIVSALKKMRLPNDANTRRKIRRHLNNHRMNCREKETPEETSVKATQNAVEVAKKANEHAGIALKAAQAATALARAAAKVAKKTKAGVSDVGGRRTRKQAHQLSITKKRKNGVVKQV